MAIDPLVERKVLEDLARLPIEEQRRVSRRIHEMVDEIAAPGGSERTSGLPRGVSGRELLRFHGILDKDFADEMERVIEEECERIDVEEW